MAYICNQMVELRIQLIKDIIEKKRRVSEVSEILKVSRQSVSKWIARFTLEGEAGIVPKKSGPKKGNAWNRIDLETEELIENLAKKYKQEGTVFLADKVKYDFGVELNQSTIFRILRRRKVRYYKRDEYKRRRKKMYSLDIPGRELQLDVCFPFGRQRREVVYDAVDDCTRWVYAQLEDDLSTFSSISFVKKLIKAAPFPIKAIRTDCGGEFHFSFTRFLESQGITHIRNSPYTPQHNGKIERYHRTFKERCNYSLEDSFDEFQYKLKQFFYWYNFQKKHSGLGMLNLTPAQKLAYSIILQSFSQNVNLTLQCNINKHNFTTTSSLTKFLHDFLKYFLFPIHLHLH